MKVYDVDHEEEKVIIGPPDMKLPVEIAKEFKDDLAHAIHEIEDHKREKELEEKKKKAQELEVPEFSKEEIMERVTEVLPDSKEEAEKTGPGKYPSIAYFIATMVLNNLYLGSPAPQDKIHGEFWRSNKKIVKVEDELERRIPQLIRYRGEGYGMKSDSSSTWHGRKVYWIEDEG